MLQYRIHHTQPFDIKLGKIFWEGWHSIWFPLRYGHAYELKILITYEKVEQPFIIYHFPFVSYFPSLLYRKR